MKIIKHMLCSNLFDLQIKYKADTIKLDWIKWSLDSLGLVITFILNSSFTYTTSLVNHGGVGVGGVHK